MERITCNSRKRAKSPVPSQSKRRSKSIVRTMDLEVNTEKVRPLRELAEVTARCRSLGKTVVMCHGVFDLIHLGHVRHLNSAKKLGDILIVTITADQFVKKGPGRPIFNEQLRAEALANLTAIDFVGIVEEPTALTAIELIKPRYYVKGPDYKNKSEDVTAKILEEEAAVARVGGEIYFTDDVTFSSSQLINNYFDVLPEKTTQYLRSIASKYSIKEIQQWITKAQELKVLVVGDSIIDQYHYCRALGKSSKDSIVAQKYLHEENFAGGALATANHVAEMVGSVDLVTVLGKKLSHEKFIRGKLNPAITPHFFYRPGAVTTIKRRYIGEESQQKLFEICFLDDDPLNEKEKSELDSYLRENISNFDLVVVNDFGHGMLANGFLKLLSEKSKCLALNVQTNSANHGFNLVTKYRQADFICIDERELRLATHDRYSDLPPLVKQISKELSLKQLIVTRGRDGSISYDPKNGFIETPTFAKTGVDKVGAGDAFFSYVAPLFAIGAPKEIISLVGNAVGSLAIQIVGNRDPVRLVDLQKFLIRLLKM